MLVQNAFSFTANCKNLEATLKKVVAVMSTTTSPSYFLASDKKRVYVVGISGDTFVRIALHEVKADVDGAFGFKQEDLVGLIKNRNDLVFSFNGQVCEFKQVKGSYKGNIVVNPITSDQSSSCDAFLSGKAKADVVMPADLLSLVKSGLAATNIKDVYQNTTLLSYITLDKKGNLEVSSFDSQHFGLFQLGSGIKGLEFKAAVPASHFSLIDQIAAGQDSKFTVSGGSLRVEGKGFTIVLPSTQADDAAYTMVASFVTSLDKPSHTCNLDLSQLTTITDNLCTLYNANTSFVFAAKESSSNLSVSFTTPSGTASDMMKVTTAKTAKAFKASVDPRLFKDVLSLARFIGTPSLQVGSKVLSFKGETSEKALLFIACARSE